MMDLSLSWFPKASDWRTLLKGVGALSDPKQRWQSLVELANSALDFVTTTLLDRALQTHFSESQPPPSEFKSIRLAVLSSSTVDHLLPSIRVAALRRGIWCVIHKGTYGQYLQEVFDESSELAQFKPNVILFALDAYHLAETDSRQGSQDQTQTSLQLLKTVWQAASQRFHCPIFQNTLLPVFDPLFGSNEHRLVTSPAEVVRRLNHAMREAADECAVHLIALDHVAAQTGVGAWHDPSLWHHAKQEISPAAAPLYGDLVGRLLAAVAGRSYKCLVLDLDNTLWGGVVGDDGVAGLALGNNSALGEAYLQFQRYVLRLSQRGIILAVCSKNDEANALAPFKEHSEMVLRTSDIAYFAANWEDKASNIRVIAKALNIGLDSLVFVDDNPFERMQVRRELPMVAVPEMPEDPAAFSSLLSSAGYFEGIALTEEDSMRTALYRENAERSQLLQSSSDVGAYLKTLGMRLVGGPIDHHSLKRATQLINKTNQFNLTTKRYTEEEVAAFVDDPFTLTVQLRLIDRFGDSGIICIVVGKLRGTQLLLDSWLMSCRVLGRQVEEASLNIVVAQAAAMGARELIGYFIPTSKNGMVKDLYPRLGFTKQSETADNKTFWSLTLDQFVPLETHIEQEYALTNYATT